ncbi:MAG: hypothetical protein ACRDSP_21500 [Pseudonocardiaceae bacterium]
MSTTAVGAPTGTGGRLTNCPRREPGRAPPEETWKRSGELDLTCDLDVGAADGGLSWGVAGRGGAGRGAAAVPQRVQ